MGVGWYKFVAGCVVLFRKKQNIENMSIATIGHQLQKKEIQNEISRPLFVTSSFKLNEFEKDGLERFPCRTVDQDKALLIDHY